VSHRRLHRKQSSAGNLVDGAPLNAAAEASVRQLLAVGDHGTALERAKDIHKACGTAASEALLVDAYAERIRSLAGRNLTLEATSLHALVCQRYPSAKARLAQVMTRVTPRAASLADLVRPLNDPELDLSQRAAIERAVQQEVSDLTALAACDALPADHPLRTAARALERAFVTVTSGPVGPADEDRLALPEVSHRSPLAPWKLLVRAIASFHAGDDESCRRSLSAVSPESAPARLVPAIQTMLGAKDAKPLTPAAAALSAQVAGGRSLPRALEELDQAFASGRKDRILKAISPVISASQESLPGQLEALRRHILVRCAVADLDPAKVTRAVGGPSGQDAAGLQLFARAMEETRDPAKVLVACGAWEEFRHTAAQEGWFPANGAEAATLALHVAELLRQLPDELLRELQQAHRWKREPGEKKPSFLSPDELYQRACALDPHPEAFAQWLAWAATQSPWEVERVARAWHKIRPRDIEPIVRLMQASEASGAFPSALTYLEKVEQIDPLHHGVREARPRLLARTALRYLQQKKPALAGDAVDALAALPQTQQGDKAAFHAALRFVIRAALGHGEEAAGWRAEVERLLESAAAAAILLSAVATAAKQRALVPVGSPGKFSSAELTSLPGALARVAVLAAEMRLTLEIPASWMDRVARQFPASRHSLSTRQLRALGESALKAGQADLAYAVSAEGLARGGTTEPRFLLLRAQAITQPFTRCVVCAAAAAELARQQQDTDLVNEAVEIVRVFQFSQVSLTLTQARDVLQKEKTEAAPPTRKRPGPDYQHLIPVRRAIDPFDDLVVDDVEDDEYDDDFESSLPPDMPPDLAEIFAQEIEKARRRGESVESFMARLLAGAAPRRRRRKRRRR
jgi:tetratricopeptide (TPR) repeat protein